MTRVHYTPRFTPWPIKAVRWRSQLHGYGTEARLAWKLYLFGLLPIASLPRRSREVAK